MTFVFRTVAVLIDQVLKSGVAPNRLRRSWSFLDISIKISNNTGRFFGILKVVDIIEVKESQVWGRRVLALGLPGDR